MPAHVAANFEGWWRASTTTAGGGGHLWKLVRTFDDPATWTEPGVRQLAANGRGGEAYRTDPLDDQWELYDLTATRRGGQPLDRPGAARAAPYLRMQLKQARATVPERNQPWPYAPRRPPTAQPAGAAQIFAGIKKRISR